MLDDTLKQTIQTAYSEYLSARDLTARYGQKLMVAHIARTLGNIAFDDAGDRLGDNHVAVIEAGTGTGKTVAYLVATLPIAKARDKAVVISTATVALQEQILAKDLPQVKQFAGLDFKFALAKGRGRYVCQSKLDRLLHGTKQQLDPNQFLFEDEKPADEKAVQIFESMAEANAAGKWDGDRDNWDEGVDDDTWSRLTTNRNQCTGRRCSFIKQCSFFKAREDLNGADVIIANHDLLLADLSLGGGAILPAPKETFYIIDEGHHLPDKALSHFAHHARILSTSRWLEQCNKQLGKLLSTVDGAGDIERFGEQLPALFAEVKRGLDEFLPLIEHNCTFESAGFGNRDNEEKRFRFARGIVPEHIRSPAHELWKSCGRLTDILERCVKEINEAMEDAHCPVPKVDLEGAFPVFGTWQGRVEALRDLWASYAAQDDPNYAPTARWITQTENMGSHDYEVCSSPILAAGTLISRLWQPAAGAVLTSATLTALGRFDRLRQRAGTPYNSCYEQVPSPFDFQNSATLQVPEQAVEADAKNADAHTRALVKAIPELVEKAKGSLVLFSSRKQMLDVYDSLPFVWQTFVLKQGESSKQALLEEHKRRVDEEKTSVIFGLASFAEGVDLPGDYCQHVIIAKLPFAVPDAPVEAALSEWIESRGGNAFMEITVPDAAVKLVQAAGRLLRTENDRGTISILDKRITSRRYGSMMLDSLPPFKREL